MKILYIAYSCDPFNGSEDQIGWNIPWESSKYNTVYVITKLEHKKAIDNYLEKYPNNNIKFYFIDILNIYKKIFIGSFYSGRLYFWNNKVYNLAKKICREKNISIIHQITPVEFRAIGKYGKIENIKFLCGPIGGGQYIDSSFMKYLSFKEKIIEQVRYFINCFYRWYLKKSDILKHTDYIFFANKETLDFLYYKNLEKKSELYTDIGIDEKKLGIITFEKTVDNLIRFIVVGRLIYIKGHSFLLECLNQLPRELKYSCKIIGDGPLKNKIEEKIKKLDLENNVEVVGKIPYKNMKYEYKKSDVLLFPTFRDTTGTVILEAIKNGVSVVTINKFGAKLLLNEENSYLYSGNTKEEYIKNLREILIKCIKEDDSQKIKRKKAYEDIRKYTWKNKVEYYQKIYLKLLSEDKKYEKV